MNKNEYLNKVKEVLINANVDNIEEIISELDKKYEIGLMAGLSDEEIISDLGKEDDILRKYQNKNSEYCFMDMEINDPFSSDINIINRDENGIDIKLSKELKDKLTVVVEDDQVTIKPIGNKTHFRIRSSEMAIYIGPNIKFNKVTIFTVSGDSTIGSLSCESAKIDTVSGDFDIESLSAKSLNLETVSGDISINELKVDNCVISCVSGDIDVNSCKIGSLVVSTISGDVEMTGSVKTSKCSRISGDITINNMEY